MEKVDNGEIAKLKMENQLFKEIIDNAHESIYAADKDGRIILFNTELERTEGIKREKLLGRLESECYPGPPENNFGMQVTKRIIETGQPLLQKRVKYKNEDGRFFESLLDAYPFIYEGEFAGIYTIGPNIKQQTEFMSVVQELQWKRNQKTNAGLFRNGAQYILQDILGCSEEIQNAISSARKIAIRPSAVLIYGETGTGKELFAHGIHNASPYAKGPFIAINCAAIPETLLESIIFGTQKGAYTGARETPGLFEQAEGGTLFLDEINSMPKSLQAKLLRVLQDKVVRRLGSDKQKIINCRIISATNRDPAKDIKKSKMRADLYYRLATVTLVIPPLREHPEDIFVLSKHFLKKYNLLFGLHVEGFSAELREIMGDYPWPGNVRELENMIENAMNFIDAEEKILTSKHVPTYIMEKFLKRKKISTIIPDESGKLRDILNQVEKYIIEKALIRNNGNITHTAEELGILRQGLHYRLRKFGLNR